MLVYWLDIIGTAVFAISGVLLAGKLRMDPFGVLVLGVVAAAGVLRRARRRVGAADRQRVFLDAAGAVMMQVAVVQVIDVAVVLEARVAATGAVLVQCPVHASHISSMEQP